MLFVSGTMKQLENFSLEKKEGYDRGTVQVMRQFFTVSQNITVKKCQVKLASGQFKAKAESFD